MSFSIQAKLRRVKFVEVYDLMMSLYLCFHNNHTQSTHPVFFFWRNILLNEKCHCTLYSWQKSKQYTSSNIPSVTGKATVYYFTPRDLMAFVRVSCSICYWNPSISLVSCLQRTKHLVFFFNQFHSRWHKWHVINKMYIVKASTWYTMIRQIRDTLE